MERREMSSWILSFTLRAKTWLGWFTASEENSSYMLWPCAPSALFNYNTTYLVIETWSFLLVFRKSNPFFYCPRKENLVPTITRTFLFAVQWLPSRSFAFFTPGITVTDTGGRMFIGLKLSHTEIASAFGQKLWEWTMCKLSHPIPPGGLKIKHTFNWSGHGQDAALWWFTGGSIALWSCPALSSSSSLTWWVVLGKLLTLSVPVFLALKWEWLCTVLYRLS